MLLSHPQEIHQQAIVVRPRGSLNFESAEQFQNELNAAVTTSSHSNLLVDMRWVEGIDSAGVMALVSAIRVARKVNKRFSLCSVSHSVKMILELTQLDKMLEIVESPVSFLENPVYN